MPAYSLTKTIGLAESGWSMRDFKFTSKQSDIKPIMMVYGSPGVGKTTMTKSIPNKVIFDLNHGTSGYDMDSDILDIGNPSPEDLYNTVVEALYFIYNSLPDKKWIIIDTVHELEKAIMGRVIKENPTLKTSKGWIGEPIRYKCRSVKNF